MGYKADGDRAASDGVQDSVLEQEAADSCAITPQGEDGENVPGYFFGQYLVDQGAISAAQLESAVAMQQENNQFLGAMARSYGYLSQSQMEAVLEEQSRVNKQFGRIAQEKGWLDSGQIEHLLKEQSKNHCFLGEALLRLGYLKPSELHEHLESFRGLEYEREQHLLSAIQDFESPKRMRAALTLTRDVFHRQGFMIKAVEAKMALPRDMHGECFLASQKRKNRQTDYFGLLLTPGLISLMARGNLCTPQSPMQQERELETVSELVFNLNYMLCSEFRELGIKTKPGSVLNRTLSGLPEYRTMMSVVFSTTTDSLCLLYLLQ